MPDHPELPDPAQASVAPAEVLKAGPIHIVAGPRPNQEERRWRLALQGHPGLAPGDLVWHQARWPGELERLAARAAQRVQQGGGMLVACGGDGTINTVARHAWPAGLPMAVLPLGTFNYFSRAHALGDGPLEAMDRLLQARAAQALRPVPVGLLNGRVFVVNASLGLYPRLLAAREAANARLGRSRWVALWAGLRALWRSERHQALRFRLHDAADPAGVGTDWSPPLPVATLFIGNNALQLARLGFDGEQALALDDRHLVGLMFAPQPRLARLRMAWRAAIGRLPDEPALEARSLSGVDIDVPPGRFGRRVRRIRVALDGERQWMNLPLRCERAPHPLWLVAEAEPAEPPVRGAASTT